MSKNPYLNKFSKSFNMGFAVVIFLLLVLFSLFCANESKAATQVDLPVTCLSADEFVAEYTAKTFEITGKTSVIVFVKNEAFKVAKLTTESTKDGVLLQGTWLIENSGKFCLIFLENKGKMSVL